MKTLEHRRALRRALTYPTTSLLALFAGMGLLLVLIFLVTIHLMMVLDEDQEPWQGNLASGMALAPPRENLDVFGNWQWQTYVAVRAVPDTGAIEFLVVGTNDGEMRVADLEALGKYLAKKRGELGNPEAVRIAADFKLKRGHLREVIAVCRQAGFQRIGIVPPHDPDNP